MNLIISWIIWIRKEYLKPYNWKVICIGLEYLKRYNIEKLCVLETNIWKMELNEIIYIG